MQVISKIGHHVPYSSILNPIGHRYMDPKNYMHTKLYKHAKYNKLIWVNFFGRVWLCFECILVFTYPPPLPFLLVILFLFCALPQDLIQVVNDPNLQSFFYEAVYNVVSTIDYSKESMDVGIIETVPPKKIFHLSPSPSFAQRGYPWVQLWLGLPFLVWWLGYCALHLCKYCCNFPS